MQHFFWAARDWACSNAVLNHSEMKVALKLGENQTRGKGVEMVPSTSGLGFSTKDVGRWLSGRNDRNHTCGTFAGGTAGLSRCIAWPNISHQERLQRRVRCKKRRASRSA